MQGVEEILETKTTIIKEVEVAKEASQKSFWHGRADNRNEWLRTSHM
jgi:hypothetical protein